MKSYIRSAALIGSCLLGAGCQESSAPVESTFIPEAEYLPAGSVTLQTRVSGVAWDPEAFYSYVFYCGGPNCFIPQYLSEGVPMYLRSAVRGASVLAFDPMAAMPVGAPATADALGIWTLPNGPSRSTAPFFILSTGQGALPTEIIGPPFPPTPPTTYLPTFTLRPIRTVAGACGSQEAIQMGSNGILEAVAKYLSVVKGKPTMVRDFLDPAQYHAVTVVGMFAAGNPLLRLAAAGTSLEASFGGGPDKVNFPVYYVDFAPPGTPPANLRSTRGFIVSDTPTTPTGFAVVLVPTSSPRPPIVTYTITDPVTAAAPRRPWVFPPVSAPPAPTVIGFLPAQMHYSQPNVPIYADPPPPAVCLPE
jgi:hypothetical protein